MIKKIIVLLFVVGAVVAFFAYDKYKAVFTKNVADELADPFVYIPTGSTLDDVVVGLTEKGILLNEASFRWVADQMSYSDATLKPGRYKITPGWSNHHLIGHLRKGQQATVKLVLNNERLLEEVAGKAAQFIETDSQSIAELLFDESYITQIGYDRQSLMSLFIPNTYDFFWNTNAEGFVERMIREHKNFWDKKGRLTKAADLDLSKEEVYTLASIVERETNKNDEKARIAGVYLNRLEKGILLQADPTVVFANGDFGLRRVLNRHIAIDSPYNTYKYAGLPPGPISMASIRSIDAVLNAEDHDYIFFCAKPDYSGYHAFAKTLRGHNRNAAKYHKWISRQRR